MDIIVPIPVAFIEVVWYTLGVSAGEIFGKNFDQLVQETGWFKGLSQFWKDLVSKALKFFHHGFIGAFLVIYIASHPETFWFGWGLISSDIADMGLKYGKKISEKLKK